MLSIYATDAGYRELASHESGTESDVTPPRDAVAPLTPRPRVNGSGGCVVDAGRRAGRRVAGAGRRIAGAGRRFAGAGRRLAPAAATLTAQISGAVAAIQWVMEHRGFGPDASRSNTSTRSCADLVDE